MYKVLWKFNACWILINIIKWFYNVHKFLVNLPSSTKSTSALQKLTANKPSSPVKTANKNEDSPATQGIKQSGGIAGRMKALLEKKTTISQAQIDNRIKEQRQKEMDLLLNRFNKQKEVIIFLLLSTFNNCL